MRAAVRASFLSYTVPLEGLCKHMYLDRKGLVTTAIGNLIDPIQYALTLPFKKPSGAPATVSEIAAEWQYVKSRTDLMDRGGGFYASITSLRLTDEGVDEVVFAKLDQIWDHLVRRFPNIQGWPADAQLGIISMAWALGPAFTWPMFVTAAKADNFRLCAAECKISGTGTIVRRSDQQKALFLNAADVIEHGADPEVLYWPGRVPLVKESAPTLPSAPRVVTFSGIQTALKDAGFDPGPLDGKPGPKTTAAVKSFQKAHGLVVDGVIGPKTLVALGLRAQP